MFVVPLKAAGVDLEAVGGKGRSLSQLLVAGYEVPPGFVVASTAYRRFVADKGLGDRILDLARPAVVDGAVSFEAAAAGIQQLFAAHRLADELVGEIGKAYAGLEAATVAVRSSANAEDLPEASFAGQQETYLNVSGEEAVVAAVRDCWASLWTPRAMNYRHEMDIDHAAVAMAVVVQAMVPAEVSGILFTANPGTGDRHELIVNASFGLGEAVVGGQVTPDTFVIDRETLTAKETVIGDKDRMVVPDGDQGVQMETIADDRRGLSSLEDEQLSALAALAIDVERTFDGVPQDIEWAWCEDPDGTARFSLLQSRPITNLPPPPPGDVAWPEIPGAQLMKRQVAENMPDPLSPLFEDLYLRALFDVQKWPEGWEWKGNETRNWMKNFVVITVNGYAYQPIYHGGSGDWDKHMAKVRTAQAKRSWWANLKGSFAMREFMITEAKGGPLPSWIYLFVRTLRTFRKYPAIVRWQREQLPDYLAVIGEWEARDPVALADAELLAGMQSLTLAEARYWLALRSVIGTAKLTDGGFQRFLEENAPSGDGTPSEGGAPPEGGGSEGGFISGSFLSGFPSRTLDAEFAARAIADRIRDDPELMELVIVTPAPRLLGALREHPHARAVCEAIDTYLDDFGRQVFNLDFVEPALAEDPLPFAVGLKALVRDPGYDLATRQRAVARARRRNFVAALRFFRGRRRLEFLRAYWTARINYPSREEALFHMGRAWSTFRPLALELGRRLVARGTLGREDDVFYVTSDDLGRSLEADGAALAELGDKAQAQRRLRSSRFRMEQPAAIPPLQHKGPYATVVSNAGDEDVLRGFAVSPGTVTGEASVIMTPNDFGNMKPGSILVCPLTTPAWTQLFPHATGLATDIGSILAHGSIVAREYGIPAVLGIGDVTRRVKSGQRIAVDGGRGTVTILT